MTEPELFQRMLDLDHTERTSYAEKGQICLKVKKQMLHQNRIDPDTGEPCSLTRWIRLASPYGYSTSFAAMRDMEDLADIPVRELSEIPQANFPILRQLSTAVRSQPAVIEAAKTKRTDEFIGQIKRDHPEQAIERNVPLRFMASESDAAQINKAIGLSIERGAMSRTQALLDLAINYEADVLLERLQEAK